jgi:hypothetical protein
LLRHQETVASIIRTIFAQPATMNTTAQVLDEVVILPELAAA